MRRLAVAVAAILFVAGGIWTGLEHLPPRHSPFAPLDLNDPIGLATGLKIAALRRDSARCMAVLSQSHVIYAPVAEQRTGPYCGYFATVDINRSITSYSRPVRVTCAMAASLYLWEREVLVPAARAQLGVELARIDHVGTYACRPINGRRGGRPSEHAIANAIDVVGFRFGDGRRVSVLQDWGRKSPEGRFLREAKSGACRLFRAVLTPDFNDRHRDHFHLDLGRYKSCR